MEKQGVTRRLQMYGLDENQPTVENRAVPVSLYRSLDRGCISRRHPAYLRLRCAPRPRSNTVRSDTTGQLRSDATNPSSFQYQQAPPSIRSSFYPWRSSFPLLITYQLPCLATRVTITLPTTSTNSSLTLSDQNLASSIPCQYLQPSPFLSPSTYLPNSGQPMYPYLSMAAETG